MSTPVIIAIDEGTTNAKAICVDARGQMVYKASRPLSLSHPQPGWSEQDPWAIMQAVQETLQECLSQLDGAYHPAGIGISNQRESVMVWERASGTPMSPLVSWQCRRSAPFCEQLAQHESQAQIVMHKTGLPIDPLFPAAKVRLLLDGIPDGQARAARGELCVGTVDSWLVWQLSGQHAFVTDYSNAARTQLLNIHEQDWDNELLAIFGIPRACLPQLMPSAGLRATTLNVAGIPDGIPLLAQIGDSHAALYGQGGFLPGVIKATYGTGSSLMTPVTHITGDDYRLGRTIAWHDGALTYALEGNITHTGAGLAWMSQVLGIADKQVLTDMAQGLSDNQGVYFVPALSGLGAPYWDTQARGVICGLTDNATPALLARAALESIAYQIADVFHLMESLSGQTLDTLLVDGGPTQNRWLMQFQADLLQRRIVRGKTAEVSALGAAYLTGKALGWWQDHAALAALDREVECIEPAPPSQAMTASYQGWLAAVERTRFRPVPSAQSVSSILTRKESDNG